MRWPRGWPPRQPPAGTKTLTPFEIKTQAIDSRGAELAAEIRRLHERLHPDAAPRLAGPQSFRVHRAAPQHRAHQYAAGALRSGSIDSAADAEAFGAGRGPGPDGSVVRTAISRGRGQLFLAKEGELVTGRYRIVRISSDGVELLDLVDDSTLRLVLK